MVPLSSHSRTQWGQLGENLGGVKVPERIARFGFVSRPAIWGSSVEYRWKKVLILEATGIGLDIFDWTGPCFCGIKYKRRG